MERIYSCSTPIDYLPVPTTRPRTPLRLELWLWAARGLAGAVFGGWYGKVIVPLVEAAPVDFIAGAADAAAALCGGFKVLLVSCSSLLNCWLTLLALPVVTGAGELTWCEGTPLTLLDFGVAECWGFERYGSCLFCATASDVTSKSAAEKTRLHFIVVPLLGMPTPRVQHHYTDQPRSIWTTNSTCANL
jgi:hypothetical protein